MRCAVAENEAQSDAKTDSANGVTIPIEIITWDQRRRWDSGDRILLETYFKKHPDWHFTVEDLLDLIYHEILVRESHGEYPSPHEYAERFPHLVEELRLHFEVHRSFPNIEATKITDHPAGSVSDTSLNRGDESAMPIPKKT